MATAFAMLVGTVPMTASAAPKQLFSAVINGHKFKAKNKHVEAGLPGDLGISVTGGKTPHRLGQTIKALVVTCVSGLEGGTFPAQGQTCTIGYSETKISRNPTYKQWAAAYGEPIVTFLSFDGTHVKGVFTGTMEPVTGTTESLTVTNGQFIVVVP